MVQVLVKTPLSIWLFIGISLLMHALLLLLPTTPAIEIASSQHAHTVQLSMLSETRQSKPVAKTARPEQQQTRESIPARTTQKPAKRTPVTSKPVKQKAPSVTMTARKKALQPDPKPELQPEPVAEMQAKPVPENTAIEPVVRAQVASSPQLNSRIRKQLNFKMQFAHHYPMMAVRNAWQGQVDLGIRVQADGQLTHITVINSSGYSVLDEAAISSIRQVASLPEASFWLNGHAVDVILPVIYRLTDS